VRLQKAAAVHLYKAAVRLQKTVAVRQYKAAVRLLKIKKGYCASIKKKFLHQYKILCLY